jgi:hypothetical protein
MSAPTLAQLIDHGVRWKVRIARSDGLEIPAGLGPCGPLVGLRPGLGRWPRSGPGGAIRRTGYRARGGHRGPERCGIRVHVPSSTSVVSGCRLAERRRVERLPRYGGRRGRAGGPVAAGGTGVGTPVGGAVRVAAGRDTGRVGRLPDRRGRALWGVIATSTRSETAHWGVWVSDDGVGGAEQQGDRVWLGYATGRSSRRVDRRHQPHRPRHSDPGFASPPAD